jgi:Trm5-related predicted tRNA methylase
MSKREPMVHIAMGDGKVMQCGAHHKKGMGYTEEYSAATCPECLKNFIYRMGLRAMETAEATKHKDSVAIQTAEELGRTRAKLVDSELKLAKMQKEIRGRVVVHLEDGEGGVRCKGPVAEDSAMSWVLDDVTCAECLRAEAKRASKAEVVERSEHMKFATLAKTLEKQIADGRRGFDGVARALRLQVAAMGAMINQD